MWGLEGDFSDSNNKISAIRVSESISTQRSPYATIPSLRFVTRVHYDFFLSRSLSFSLHYLHFVHCSSHFFSFSRVTRERYIYIYTRIYEWWSIWRWWDASRRWRGLEKEIPRDKEQKNLRRSECRNCHRAIGRKDRPTMLLCTVHSSPFRTLWE